MPKPSTPSDIVYRVAELLAAHHSAQDIARIINAEFAGLHLSRERVYPLVGRAVESGFLRLVPPMQETLARALEKKFRCLPHSIRVVDCPAPGSGESVSAAAAAWAVELLPELGKSLGRTVGLGLGPGRATLDFARSFGRLLDEPPELPKLNLIAITAGGPALYPDYTPTSFFNLFRPQRVEKRIGLFAQSLVRSGSFADVQKCPGVREAFDARRAGMIDMVITSMGAMDDPHALLRIFYEASGGKPRSVEQAVGDVQYRPFTKEGFVEEDEDELRAVTLFELEDLVRLAEQKHRVVMLIARQCGACGDRNQTRAAALRPLLENRAMRVFSHLVTDASIARDLLGKR